MRHAFLPSAKAELQEAVDFYEDRRAGLGEEFAAEVRSTVGRILLNPTAWSKLSENARRCRLRRFPYGLIYQIRRDQILILAVMHFRRSPGYWRSRLNS